MLQIMDTESVMQENSPAPPPSAMAALGEGRGQQSQGESCPKRQEAHGAAPERGHRRRKQEMGLRRTARVRIPTSTQKCTESTVLPSTSLAHLCIDVNRAWRRLTGDDPQSHTQAVECTQQLSYGADVPERRASDSSAGMTHGDSRVPGRRPRRRLLARRGQRLCRCVASLVSRPAQVRRAA